MSKRFGVKDAVDTSPFLPPHMHSLRTLVTLEPSDKKYPSALVAFPSPSSLSSIGASSTLAT